MQQIASTCKLLSQSLHKKTENKYHQHNLWNLVIDAINNLSDMIRSVARNHYILSVITLSVGGCWLPFSLIPTNTLLVKTMTPNLQVMIETAI